MLLSLNNAKYGRVGCHGTKFHVKRGGREREALGQIHLFLEQRKGAVQNSNEFGRRKWCLSASLLDT